MTDTAETGANAAARAELLIELGSQGEAAALLERALATDPDDVDLLDLLTQAQLELDPAAALETAKQLAAIDPQSHRPPLLASMACDELDRKNEAIAYAREAVGAAPWLPNTHAQLAQTLVGKRWRGAREARRAAREAIELAPDSHLGYVTAGNVELGRGRVREAERFYRRALEVDPTSRPAQVNVALTNKVRGRVNRAFGDVESILRLDPRDDGARELLDGIVYTTLVHLQWVVIALAATAAIVRDL